MAHFIFIKHKKEKGKEALKYKKDKIKEKVFPVPHQNVNEIYSTDLKKNEELLIFNPSESLKFKGTSIIGGSLYQLDQEAFRVSKEPPDSFTFLIKSSRQKVIAKTGILASRTIWYYLDEAKLIISSSQRAITALIGKFNLNQQALSWFISTGMTGPGNSWNEKIKWLGPDATLELDNYDWKESYTQKTTTYEVNELKAPDKKELLNKHLSNIFSRISVNNNSFLTLSGGADSRLIASLIKKYKGLNIDAVTWGDMSKKSIQKGDIWLAERVAEYLNLDHKLFDINPLKNGNNSLKDFIENFVRIGEGRIDHFSGYFDNFKLWNELVGQYDTVIRGDEVFGWLPVFREMDLRVMLCYHEIGIYRNMKTLNEYGLPSMNFPEWLERIEGETLPQWRDRLFNYHNVSTKQASLQDLKYPFVETLNPLIHSSIVELSRTFSDRERTDKALYLEAINKHIPKMPFAEVSTLPSVESLMKRKNNVEYIQDTLNSQSLNNLAGSILTKECKNLSLSPEDSPLSVNSLKRNMKKYCLLPLKSF